LIWLDPMPLAEDIGKAYANYYTHVQPADSRIAPLKRLVNLAEQTYIRNKFGYPSASKAIWHRLLSASLYLLPIRRRNLAVWIRFLQFIPGGKVLDVGCGCGEWLAWMQELGWTVEGVDFDPGAVKAARLAGLKVNCGSVEDQQYPDASFDAVTLNHVIEHVPDPVATLRECGRILKPGGKLVVVTPNGASLGHRFFKQDWRGLETPRHLHIFSPASMERALGLAGFREVSIQPQIVRSIPYESYLLRLVGSASSNPGRRFLMPRVFASLFNSIELCLLPCDPSVSDCLVARVIKI
jgi:2-polyprenyl-3-methyl-5-hydroxy-6-metoxy-1,4-benzoquinol methylase